VHNRRTRPGPHPAGGPGSGRGWPRRKITHAALGDVEQRQTQCRSARIGKKKEERDQESDVSPSADARRGKSTRPSAREGEAARALDPCPPCPGPISQ